MTKKGLLPRGSGGARAPGRPRVLLVESDHEIRDLIRRFLEMQGFECRGTSDAETAMRLIPGRDRFDVVVATASLPVDAGFELLGRLRATDRRPPLLVLRGFVGPHRARERRAAARLGARFLDGPIRLATLLEAVQEALFVAAESESSPESRRFASSSASRVAGLAPA